MELYPIYKGKQGVASCGIKAVQIDAPSIAVWMWRNRTIVMPIGRKLK